ncbi:MAG: His-Xaa-Ser system radical SAM maturase HxsB, partial [Candidatus Gastranaerophilales bacterium]|nr:His-Xaa-Ser system radical SAM maturase HxsB [Candidatus Gastranaerophilales bacterium]
QLYKKELISESPVYKKLKSKHFIAAEDDLELAEDMLAAKLRTRKAFISDFTSLHMIVATLRCNCLCKYCHASSVDLNSKNYDMDRKTAQKTIEMIFQTPSPEIKIEYQGGEPLLNWETVKESILYAEFLNTLAKKNLSFVICTNLTDITGEQIAFLKKHNVEMSTSFGGDKTIHDLNRKSYIFENSNNEFIKNLKTVREQMGENACSALLTITKSNLYKLRSIIDNYVALGFKNIFLRALNPYGNAVINKDELSYSNDEFINVFKDALNYIIELNKKGTEFVECYTALFLKRILTPYSTGFTDLQSPFGAGISGVIYNYNGDIYPADEGRMLSRMGDDYFKMGNVKTSRYSDVFGGEIIRNMINSSCVETMPVCSECVYQQYCGTDVIRNYAVTKDLTGDRLKSDFCRKNRAVMDYIFELLNSNDEDIKNIFWSWAIGKNYKDIKLENNKRKNFQYT